VYDEAENTPWAELPDDWKCPLCGAAKSDFAPEGASQSSTETIPAPSITADMKPLTAIETAHCVQTLPKDVRSNTSQNRQLLSGNWQIGLRHRARQIQFRLSNGYSSESTVI
jgi:Rubredoxin